MFPRQKHFRFEQRTAHPEEKRNQQAADEQWGTPSPARRHDNAQQRGEHHRHLLAGGLPARIETIVAGSRYLGEIDGSGANLYTRGKSLH